jgi:hypothetical protein
VRSVHAVKLFLCEKTDCSKVVEFVYFLYYLFLILFILLTVVLDQAQPGDAHGHAHVLQGDVPGLRREAANGREGAVSPAP